jgi:hypothetical protein
LQQYAVAPHKNQGSNEVLTGIFETVMQIGHDDPYPRFQVAFETAEALTYKA